MKIVVPTNSLAPMPRFARQPGHLGVVGNVRCGMMWTGVFAVSTAIAAVFPIHPQTNAPQPRSVAYETAQILIARVPQALELL
jgi:hypothetical protein